MKISRVLSSNRMKGFKIELNGKSLSFPYSRLRLKPSTKDPIVEVYVDKEIGSHGFTYCLRSGKTDTILADQVLEYNRDSEYLRKMLLNKLTIQAEKEISKQKTSHREVIRRLGISPTQFYRLMNPAFYGKTIDQMVKLFAALDCEVDLVIKKAA